MISLDQEDELKNHIGDIQHLDSNVFLVQDTFQVWDPKKLIRQSRERRMFLFELYLVFSKEAKDSNGRSKYIYKMKMMVLYCIFMYIYFC